MASRYVWLDGNRRVSHLRSRNRKKKPGVLVHDADCDALRIPDLLSSQLVAYQERRERGDVSSGSSHSRGVVHRRSCRRREVSAGMSQLRIAHPDLSFSSAYSESSIMRSS